MPDNGKHVDDPVKRLLLEIELRLVCPGCRMRLAEALAAAAVAEVRDESG